VPAEQPEPRGLRAGTINVTSLRRNMALLVGLALDIVCIQEHAVDKAGGRAVRAMLATEGYSAAIGPPNPEAGCPAGGVGIMARAPRIVQPCVPAEGPFKDAWDLGRVMHALVTGPDQGALHVFSIWGWPGADTDLVARQRTAALVEATLGVIDDLGAANILLAGDLNCDIDTVPMLADRLDRRQLFDLANIPGIAGEPGKGTCLAHGSATWRRRDYLFTNGVLLQKATDCVVDEAAGFDVHRPVRVSIMPSANATRLVARQPKPIVPENLAKEARAAWSRRAANCVDAEFVARGRELTSALRNRDVDGLWRCWAAAMETGIICANPEVDHKDPAHRGRGKVMIVEQHLDLAPVQLV